MELISLHGLSDLDPHMARAVLQQADKLEDEPWYIQVGQQFWRETMEAFREAKAVMPKGVTLAQVMAALAAQTPEIVHKISQAVVHAANLVEEVRKHQDRILAQLGRALRNGTYAPGDIRLGETFLEPHARDDHQLAGMRQRAHNLGRQFADGQ